MIFLSRARSYVQLHWRRTLVQQFFIHLSSKRKKYFITHNPSFIIHNSKYILAIDQVLSSTKTLIFDDAGIAVAKGSEDLHTNYFDNGFVEQDPKGFSEMFWHL